MKSKIMRVAVLVLFFGLFAGLSSSGNSQEEDNKEIVLCGFEVINARDWEGLDEIVAPDYVRHCQATPEVKVRSLEDFKQYLKQENETFPDYQMTIQHIVAEGDLVAFYATYTGTQKGQMGPFPPSNKKMTLEFAGIHRIADGKIVETWVIWDNLAALTQLGHFPPPGQKK